MVALLAVIIVCAVSFVMSRNSLLLGLGGLDVSYNYKKAQNVLSFTEGCVEETIRQFQFDENYSVVNKNFSLNDFYCTINTGSSSSEKIITVIGNSGDYYKSLEVKILINDGNVIINNWKEI